MVDTLFQVSGKAGWHRCWEMDWGMLEVSALLPRVDPRLGAGVCENGDKRVSTTTCKTGNGVVVHEIQMDDPRKHSDELHSL